MVFAHFAVIFYFKLVWSWFEMHILLKQIFFVIVNVKLDRLSKKFYLSCFRVQ